MARSRSRGGCGPVPHAKVPATRRIRRGSIETTWACSKPVSLWLNRPPRAPHKQASEKDQRFLRLAGLRTWRYFAEFSTEEHHWLIPDNVQEEPANIAARISPTNLGFLLNARQVAYEFGYLLMQYIVRDICQ